MVIMKDINFVKQYLINIFKQNGVDKSEVNYLLLEALNIEYNDLVKLKQVSDKDFIKIKKYANKRVKGQPFTKIFHRAYFFGLTFFVNNNVLSPRQETELLVEQVIKQVNVQSTKQVKEQVIKQVNMQSTKQENEKTIKQTYEQAIKQENKKAIKQENANMKNKLEILDLCTGSGAIAISLKKNIDAKVFASDISKKALYVARKNAKKQNVNIKFFESDLFENKNLKNKKFDIIVSNPPYIETNIINTLDDEVKNYDPIIALDGGKDGLCFYRKIIEQSAKHLKEDGQILFEIGYNQKKAVEELLNKNGFISKCLKDYEKNDRIIIGTKKKENYAR